MLRVGEFAHKFRAVQKWMKENLPVCAEMDDVNIYLQYLVCSWILVLVKIRG